MRGKLIGYSGIYTVDGVEWFIPHEQGKGMFYGRVWPTLREAAKAVDERGISDTRIVAIYEIKDGNG